MHALVFLGGRYFRGKVTVRCSCRIQIAWISVSTMLGGCSVLHYRAPNQQAMCQARWPVLDVAGAAAAGTAAAIFANYRVFADCDDTYPTSGSFKTKEDRDAVTAVSYVTAAVLAVSAAYGVSRTVNQCTSPKTLSEQATRQAQFRTPPEPTAQTRLALEIEKSERERLAREQEQKDADRARGEGAAPPPTPPPPAPPSPTVSLGSCFFVSPDGIAVTNHHVIAGARRIVVIDADQTKHAATVLRASPDADLVALDVPSAAKHAAIGIDANPSLRLGQAIFTIGFPYASELGFDPKFADGAIGGLKGFGDDRLLQITIPIQPGNSGGPVATDAGIVVGVVVSRLDQLAMLKRTGTLPSNTGFALKTSQLGTHLRGIRLPTMKNTTSRADAVARTQAAACQVIALSDEH